MKNYYEILGLPVFSDIESVKKQFRKLAVIYHPDKNPDGEEKFREIAEAYEVLSDFEKKQKYDARLRYRLNFNENKFYAHTKKSPYKEKNPVDIKEAARRKYYEQYYKKKTYTGYHDKVKKVSNEFRNILIAVPLTVILFLWLISFFEKKHPAHSPLSIPAEAKEKQEHVSGGSEKYHGKKMYLDFFKRYSTAINDTLWFEVSNQTEQDMIVMLFEQTGHLLINSVYLPSYHSVVFENIPNMPGLIRIQSGEKYNSVKNTLDNNKIFGGFEKNEKFYELKRQFSNMPKKWIINQNEVNRMKEKTFRDFINFQ